MSYTQNKWTESSYRKRPELAMVSPVETLRRGHEWGRKDFSHIDLITSKQFLYLTKKKVKFSNKTL